MAFFTFDPTPTDGGSFDLQDRKFDWSALADDKFIIVYQQNNPARLFAQVVNFNGLSAPTFGPASVIASANRTSLIPKVAAVSATRALITYQNSLDDPAVSSFVNLDALVIDVDGSDNITVINVVSRLVVTVDSDLYDIEHHPNTSNPADVNILYESNTTIRTRSIKIDVAGNLTIESIKTLSSADNNTTPKLLQKIPSSGGGNTLFARAGNNIGRLILVNAGLGLTVSNSTIATSSSYGALTENIFVGAKINDLVIRNVSTNTTNTFTGLIPGGASHFLRLDDEHCMFIQGQTLTGTVNAFVFNITDVDTVTANTNNPLTIPSGIIDDRLNPGPLRKSMHLSGTSRIHYTGIIDDAGTKKIGFHIFSSV